MTNELMALTKDESVDFYCSFDFSTDEGKETLFKVMSSPDKSISEYINKVINVKDVFCDMVDLTDKETGEVFTTPRVILLDDKGVSYQSVSGSFYKTMVKFLQIYGNPTNWGRCIPIEIKQKETKNGRRIFTFELAK